MRSARRLSLDFSALDPDHVVAQTSHPETPLYCPFHRFEIVFCACIDEPKQALDDGSGLAVALEVDKRFAIARGCDDRGFLCIVCQVVHVNCYN